MFAREWLTNLLIPFYALWIIFIFMYEAKIVNPKVRLKKIIKRELWKYLGNYPFWTIYEVAYTVITIKKIIDIDNFLL